MKRLLRSALVLLTAAALVLTFGAARHARAQEGDEDTEPTNPYVGLWRIAGWIEDSVYTAAEEAEEATYLDFLPNGVIRSVIVSGESVEEDYLAYVVTEENQLVLLEGDDPVPAEYDEEAEAIVITSEDDTDGFVIFLRRVQTDPLPDVFALADKADKERLYWGCRLIRAGQAMDLAESLAIMEEDPDNFYSLILRPDGTGRLRLGSEDAGADILWNETQLVPVGQEDRPYAYSRAERRIVLSVDDDVTIEFAPGGEMSALMAIIAWDLEVTPPVIPEQLAGTWELIQYRENEREVKGDDMALSMDLALNRNGTAILYDNNGSETNGYRLIPKGENAFILSSGAVEMFELRYDGTNMVLTMAGRELTFEHTDG